METYTNSQLGENLARVLVSIAAEFDLRVALFELDVNDKVVSGTVTGHCEHVCA